MIFTQTQLDWGLGSAAVGLFVIILLMAFWPQRRRRHGKRP